MSENAVAGNPQHRSNPRLRSGWQSAAILACHQNSRVLVIEVQHERTARAAIKPFVGPEMLTVTARGERADNVGEGNSVNE